MLGGANDGDGGRSGEDPNEPYPGVGSALLLTMMAFVASIFTGVALYGLGPLAAYGIGRAIGVGSVATMAAQRVGGPQAKRLGMTRLDGEAIPLILCLIPAMLVMSELDNYAYDWAGDEPTLLERMELPPADAGGDAGAGDTAGETAEATGRASGDEALRSETAAGGADRTGAGARASELDGPDANADEEAAEAARRIFDPEDPASLTQALIVMVGIIPLVDCFLFFGVIQQGLVRRFGMSRGILVASLLWMLMRQVPLTGMTRFVVATLALLALGYLLGLLRIATGSILGPMLLASGWAGIEFLALATHDRIPLPGLNVDGTHLPVLIAFASFAVVAWAAWTLHGEAVRRYGEDDVWRGPGDEGGRRPPRAWRPDADDARGAEIHPFPPVPRPRHLDRPESEEDD